MLYMWFALVLGPIDAGAHVIYNIDDYNMIDGIDKCNTFYYRSVI